MTDIVKIEAVNIFKYNYGGAVTLSAMIVGSIPTRESELLSISRPAKTSRSVEVRHTIRDI